MSSQRALIDRKTTSSSLSTILRKIIIHRHVQQHILPFSRIPPPNKPKLVRYIQNGQEQDLLELKNEEKTSTNGHSTQSLEDQRESQRLSSHSSKCDH